MYPKPTSEPVSSETGETTIDYKSNITNKDKDEWRGDWMFSLICAWINAWVNNGEAGDLRRYRARYDVIAMLR